MNKKINFDETLKLMNNNQLAEQCFLKNIKSGVISNTVAFISEYVNRNVFDIFKEKEQKISLILPIYLS